MNNKEEKKNFFFFNFNKNKEEIIEKIDLHSHINFSVDDGCVSLEESIDLLNQAHQQNIKYIACTSHVTSTEEYIKNFNILKEYAVKLGITLVVGNEIILDIKTFELLNLKHAYTINNTQYVLVEIKNFISENYVIKSLEALIENNYIPILAHPERMHISNMKFIKDIKNTGTLIQLNAESLNKNLVSKERYMIASNLLKKDLVDLIASDVHNTVNRNYDSYNIAYKYVFKNYNNRVKNLFYNNPLKIIKGENI